MQASTYRRLQPSLILQLLMEGSYNPLTLVLDDMFTSVGNNTERGGESLLSSQLFSFSKLDHICYFS